MSPTQSNGNEDDSSQTGLNPLFLTTLVLVLTTLAEVAPPACGSEAGVYWALLSEGKNGHCVQSGTRSETST